MARVGPQRHRKKTYNIYVKLTIDNTTTVGINYKELYDCKWDPITLTCTQLYTTVFKFFYI